MVRDMSTADRVSSYKVKIRVFVLARANDTPVGRHHLDFHHVVQSRSPHSRRGSDSADGSMPADSDAWAGTMCESSVTIRGKAVVNVSETAAAADSSLPCCLIHFEFLEIHEIY